MRNGLYGMYGKSKQKNIFTVLTAANSTGRLKIINIKIKLKKFAKWYILGQKSEFKCVENYFPHEL